MRSETAKRIVLAVSTGFWLATMAVPALAICESPGGDLHARSGSGTGGTGLGGDEGSGTGGTGVRGDEGSGTGGTGVQLAESGTGGTGVWEDIGSGTGGTGWGGDEGSGTGGTGILGTVTGFGSVCVNGLRVGYDESTAVLRDGREVSSSELAIGQVVRITTGRGIPLHAERITVENVLSGPVTRVDLSQHRIWVMDQPVELPPRVPVFDRVSGRSAGLEEIGAGSLVDVSGQRRSDGVIVATRLEARSADRPDSVTGVAISAAGRTAYVGDLRARLAPEAGALTSGDRVVLTGRWNVLSRTLERASLGAASPAAGGVARLSLEGYVEPSGRGGDFEIAGTAVDTSAIEHTLARDSLVRVEGRLDRKGRLHAERIQLRRSPREQRASGIVDGSQGSKGDRSGRSGRGERGERSERGERPERSERNERPGRSGRD